MSIRDRPDAQSDEPFATHGLPLLYQLVYCSRAAVHVDDATVASIIAVSQRKNPARGITGLLVFGSSFFFQWLEGPRDNVRQLLATLTADSRHQEIVLLSETQEIRERLFPDWGMELVTSNDIRDVLLDALDTAEDPRNADALKRMIEQLDAGRVGASLTGT